MTFSLLLYHHLLYLEVPLQTAMQRAIFNMFNVEGDIKFSYMYLSITFSCFLR